MNASRNRIFWCLLVGLWSIGGLAMTQERSFGEDKAEPPEEINFNTERQTNEPRPFRGFVVWVGDGVKNDGVEPKGRFVARGEFLTDNGDIRQYPKAKTDGYVVNFPNLKPGDIVPLFGAAYRLKGSSNNSLLFSRSPAAQIPKEAIVTKDAYPFVFGYERELHGAVFQASYDKNKDGKERVTVKIHYISSPRTGRFTENKVGPQTVQVGDVVKLNEIQHRVVNIVAPDPKKKIIGWFEIEQKPVK